MDIKENIKIWTFLMLALVLVMGSISLFLPLTLHTALIVTGIVTAMWFAVSLILGPLFVWWMDV